MQKRPAKVYVKLVVVVGRLGFEPGMTEPKPVVLPLHHRPIQCGCKGSENLANFQIFTYLSYFMISK